MGLVGVALPRIVLRIGSGGAGRYWRNGCHGAGLDSDLAAIVINHGRWAAPLLARQVAQNRGGPQSQDQTTGGAIKCVLFDQSRFYKTACRIAALPHTVDHHAISNWRRNRSAPIFHDRLKLPRPAAGTGEAPNYDAGSPGDSGRATV